MISALPRWQLRDKMPSEGSRASAPTHAVCILLPPAGSWHLYCQLLGHMENEPQVGANVFPGKELVFLKSGHRSRYDKRRLGGSFVLTHFVQLFYRTFMAATTLLGSSQSCLPQGTLVQLSDSIRPTETGREDQSPRLGKLSHSWE